MKPKRIFNLLLVFALTLSVLAGCENSNQSNNTSDTQPATSIQATESTPDTVKETTDDNLAAAEKLLVDLTGSYQELWPVILADKYEQTWLDNCTDLVGKENAQASYEKLKSMVTGKVYGEDAVKAYADGNGVYDCDFTQGVDTLKFDGSSSTISGYDADGKELFSHTYHYVGMENTRGLYEYKSDDADSGEFTYFCIAPDTSDTTYHIELRYGSDLDALGQYDKGDYAYWLASGISTTYDETMIKNCIKLFCTENLSE